MDKPDQYVLERQVGFVMRRAVQRHIAIFSALIPEMTPTQFAALAKLCELGQASQNELGRLTAMDVATIKGVVDRLRARSLISSAPLESDKRRLMLTPTRQGRRRRPRSRGRRWPRWMTGNAASFCSFLSG